ncbi:hypothetical protein [Nitratireductor alexandrii]|uniref:hypothetical protein n=1 Tax=Nitratireductor alexandrii TaxID=2448161 RepID=UPI000FD8D53D|nr:hypothetical protein [Nitratireductor alexandrii]
MTGVISIQWRAWHDLMPGVTPTLYVTGEVQTSAGNMVPKLRPAVPQGINPQILILELSIEQEGDAGIQLVAFRPARYTQEAGAGAYTQVHIRHEGEEIAQLDVNEVR